VHPPEAAARENIDRQLMAAGWLILDKKDLNLHASRGVAEQSARYTAAQKWIPQRWADPLPFTYESTGIETNFRDQRDPDSCSRPVFAFHTPEHLLELVQQGNASPARATLRARLRQFPALNTAPLRECQIDAVSKLEKWLAQQQSGSGGTPLPRFTEFQIHWLDVIKNYVALNGTFATDDQSAYLDAWQSVDSDERVPLAVARKAFGGDPKAIIEELNQMLIA
jgi:hypothetical protein